MGAVSFYMYFYVSTVSNLVEDTSEKNRFQLNTKCLFSKTKNKYLKTARQILFQIGIGIAILYYQSTVNNFEFAQSYFRP